MPLKDWISPITTGLGLFLEGHEDQRQQEQQSALTQIQLEAQKELSKYNLDLQKQMWDYTGYENQVKHLKAAGLNPALLYGKSGGGGQTANLSTGSVSGANASGQSGEVLGAAAMGLQLQSQLTLQKAQYCQ